MKSWLEEHFEFSDSTDALRISFLEQGKGKLSARARKKEFSFISADDIARIKDAYREIYSEGIWRSLTARSPLLPFLLPQFPVNHFMHVNGRQEKGSVTDDSSGSQSGFAFTESSSTS